MTDVASVRQQVRNAAGMIYHNSQHYQTRILLHSTQRLQQHTLPSQGATNRLQIAVKVRRGIGSVLSWRG